MSAFLQLRGLTKSFGARRALAGVDLDLDAQGILVVLGESGAGKTTLLRTLAGLETPDAGSVHLNGRDLLKLTPAQRDVALVFQNFSLYPDWSVRRNLEFPLRAPGRRLDEAEIAARVATAAATLHIERLLDRPARALSGGEMQRVAIGRAIVRRPTLFLMDEPLTNLDAKLRESLRVELALLVRELRVPMIYVTHDQGEALSMGDAVAVLVDGRIRQVGSPREVYDRPNSPEVAALLGQPEIHLFDATSDGSCWLAADGTSICTTETRAGARARIGVRPEHWIAQFDAGGPARVELIEETGPQRVLVCSFAGGRIHVLCGRDESWRLGDRLRLSIQPDRAVVWHGSEGAPRSQDRG